VFVVSVAEDGPLAKAGVFEGSRIASVNNVDVRVPAADVGDEFMTSSRVRRVTREIEKLEPGANVELRVYSNGQYRNVTVKTVKRSELKQDHGISIFHSGGGSGVFVPPMIDMPGFRFDMNHDANRVRQRIEETLRGNEIQLRSLRDRIRDGTGSVRDLQFQLHDNGSLMQLQEMLRDLQDRGRISGDSLSALERLQLEQGFRRFQPGSPIRSTALTESDPVAPVFTTSFDAKPMFAASFDAKPMFVRSMQPAFAKLQGAQTGQGGQAAQPRSRTPGTAMYTTSGEPSAQGAVFMVAGIRFSPINAQLAGYLGTGSERGLLVLEIEDGWTGLMAGDVLLSIDGRTVCDGGNTRVFIDSSKDQPIAILRAGELVKTTLKRR
jgi:hypothetical protein